MLFISEFLFEKFKIEEREREKKSLFNESCRLFLLNLEKRREMQKKKIIAMISLFTGKYNLNSGGNSSSE